MSMEHYQIGFVSEKYITSEEFQEKTYRLLKESGFHNMETRTALEYFGNTLFQRWSADADDQSVVFFKIKYPHITIHRDL